jgi:hypothetical protein
MTESSPEAARQYENEQIAVRAAEEIAWTERANRLGRIVKDKQSRQGLEALLRTITNGSITVADMVPGMGDAASWAADACKFIARRTGIKLLDTSPDVPEWVAYVSEGLDVASCGTFPSHAIETTLQIKADLPRMKIALARLQKIWDGENPDDPEIIEATSVILDRKNDDANVA